jgi:hypothetical protein
MVRNPTHLLRVALMIHAASLLACAPAGRLHVTAPEEFVAMNPSPRRLIPRKAGSVEVFIRSRPRQPFVKVGAWSLAGAPEAVAPLARREAAVVGCDALLLRARVVVDIDVYSASTDTRTVAFCAVYSDLPASYRPPAHPCHEQDAPPECSRLNPPAIEVIEVSGRAPDR